VVLDLGLPPVPGGRGVEGFWLRLARTALAHEGALLVASPYRACGSAALAVVELARGRPRWLGQGCAPRLLTELTSTATVAKARGRLVKAARAHDRAPVEWWLGAGGVAIPKRLGADPVGAAPAVLPSTAPSVPAGARRAG
jgi:hypothetical protein